ncbi:MAG: sugar phosphate isomerase/epimerase [Bryobacterales bacterium]|nr:sugar phosphate isomerase/epimerase [Bryobacterales bacterium]
MKYTRRELGALILAGIVPIRLLAKPNSKFGGVQVGINAPYSFGNMSEGVDSILKDLLDLNLSAVELRSQPIEQSFGAPKLVRAGRNASPEQQEQAKASLDALRKWCLSQPIESFKPFRGKWNDAGVALQIIKFDAVDSMSDDEVGYAFSLARAMGADAISCEIPLSRTKWLGELATSHKFRVGYHGHAAIHNPEAFVAPASWEKAMTYSKFNCINLDIGHFVAGISTSPIPFMKKHADRITHVHIKDRKIHEGPNTVWGEGDTPIREVLQLMKREKYPFQATIEFEYKVPEGSTRMKEIARCVE